MTDAPLDQLPIEIFNDHVAVLGMTGAGKSYTARGAVEQLLGLERRAVIIDPTGVWWGLRLLADGVTPSPFQAVIFGGDHADVPLEGVSGERLADALAEGEYSAIIDTTRLTVGARTRLFVDVAERLAAVNRRRLHLVIDEAHLFAPQGRVNDPMSGRMVHAANNLVSGGRALGLRIMLLSQRPAKLHKDSLTQAKALVALQVMHKLDRNAIVDWVKDNADADQARELIQSLAGLTVGHGWVWAPRLQLLSRAKFRPIATFDSMGAPEDDDRPPARLQALNLDALRAALQAEPTAPPARKSGAKTAPAAPDAAALEAARNEGRAEGLRAGWEEGWTAGVSAAVSRYLQALDEVKVLKPEAPQGNRVDRLVRALEAAQPSPASTPSVLPPAAEQDADELPAAAAAMLEAARRSPFLVTSWSDAALLAGLIPGGGYFNTLRKSLRAAGHEAPPANERQAMGPVFLPGDLRDAFIQKLSTGRLAAVGRVFAVLWENGRCTQDVVAETAGLTMAGGYWNSVRKAVRSSTLFSTPDDTTWDIAPVLRRFKDGDA